MKKILLLIIVVVLGAGLFLYVNRAADNAASSDDGITLEKIQTDKQDEEDNDTPVDDEELLDDGDEESRSEDTVEEEAEPIVYDISTDLEAITDDAAVGTESGTAMARYTVESGYELDVTFDGLPELDADEYFYEGWVVRRDGELSVISTGALEMDADGTYVNRYTSNEDLLDHTEYVLTLEPNDGDPAPAAHVLEGIMQ